MAKRTSRIKGNGTAAIGNRNERIAIGVSLVLHLLLCIAPAFGRLTVEAPPPAPVPPVLVAIMPSKLLSTGDLGNLNPESGRAATGPPPIRQTVARDEGPTESVRQKVADSVEPPLEPTVNHPASTAPETVATVESSFPPVLTGAATEPVLTVPAAGAGGSAGSTKPPLLTGDPNGAIGSVASGQSGAGETAAVGDGGTGGNAVKMLRGSAPRYPVAARQAGWEGTVMVRVLVDRRGVAATVTIRESSGYQLLDEAVLQAVKKWRFAPATQNGNPVASFHDVRVRFRLTDP